MTKVSKRYFDKTDDKQSADPKKKTKKPKGIIQQKNDLKKDIICFNVKLKPNRWTNRNRSSNNDKQTLRPNRKYQGKAPVDPKLVQKHARGPGLTGDGIKTNIHLVKIKRKEKYLNYATEQAARTEILLTENAGYLEPDYGETTTQFNQKEIANAVDITAASKHFELKLEQFGPYRMKYTKGGRHLVLGGQRGHVAAFDWVTKRLHCEVNVMESVHDVSFLHIETMFAVAQKNWVYIYDNQGIELHCLKRLNKVLRMEFLPYHFLLATASEEGFLSWLDVSIGELVTQFNTKLGRLSMMTQNIYNAVLCVGHARGVVSMWTPNIKEPVAKMLCHKAPLTSLAVDPRGVHMVTSANDKSMKIWDIRKLHGPLQVYHTRAPVSHVALSHKGLLAAAMGNVVEVYKEYNTEAANRPYLRQRLNGAVSSMQFCPHEDVLGVATERGFTSLLVPGSGEANFDALEANPFQTKSQRRETEVRSLLEKIPSDLITLDPGALGEIDVPTLKDKIEAKQKLLFVKAPKIDYQPRNIAKRKGGSAQIARNKKIVQEETKREFVKEIKKVNETTDYGKSVKQSKSSSKNSVLDRFKSKVNK